MLLISLAILSAMAAGSVFGNLYSCVTSTCVTTACSPSPSAFGVLAVILLCPISPALLDCSAPAGSCCERDLLRARVKAPVQGLLVPRSHTYATSTSSGIYTGCSRTAKRAVPLRKEENKEKRSFLQPNTGRQWSSTPAWLFIIKGA